MNELAIGVCVLFNYPFDPLQAPSLLKLSKLSKNSIFSKNSNFPVFQFFNRGGMFFTFSKKQTHPMAKDQLNSF